MARVRVPAWVGDDIAGEIRAEHLDGQDLYDLADQVDWGADPTDWTGAGEALHPYLLLTSWVFDTSAADLIDEACVCLDWPVAS